MRWPDPWRGRGKGELDPMPQSGLRDRSRPVRVSVAAAIERGAAIVSCARNDGGRAFKDSDEISTSERFFALLQRKRRLVVMSGLRVFDRDFRYDECFRLL
jgi:hypothetical protein